MSRLAKNLGIDSVEIIAKCEYFNAGGSVKDRVGLKMIREAGVQLPKFTNQKNKMVIDVNSLNNMVKDHGHSVVTKKTKKS
jgi:cysteine synthase